MKPKARTLAVAILASIPLAQADLYIVPYGDEALEVAESGEAGHRSLADEGVEVYGADEAPMSVLGQGLDREPIEDWRSVRLCEGLGRAHDGPFPLDGRAHESARVKYSRRWPPQPTGSGDMSLGVALAQAWGQRVAYRPRDLVDSPLVPFDERVPETVGEAVNRIVEASGLKMAWTDGGGLGIAENVEGSLRRAWAADGRVLAFDEGDPVDLRARRWMASNQWTAHFEFPADKASPVFQSDGAYRGECKMIGGFHAMDVATPSMHWVAYPDAKVAVGVIPGLR